jgi:hypothetical protein
MDISGMVRKIIDPAYRFNDASKCGCATGSVIANENRRAAKENGFTASHGHSLPDHVLGQVKSNLGWEPLAFDFLSEEGQYGDVLVLKRPLGQGVAAAYIPQGPKRVLIPTSMEYFSKHCHSH